jgi:hypothetical protein
MYNMVVQMPVCNVDMWFNGVILTSVGSAILIMSIILKNTTKSIQLEYRHSEKIEIAKALKPTMLDF